MSWVGTEWHLVVWRGNGCDCPSDMEDVLRLGCGVWRGVKVAGVSYDSVGQGPTVQVQRPGSESTELM